MFDPKHMQHLIRDLATDERRFVNVEIGGSKLDFEGLVTAEDTFSWWRDNWEMGQVG
jgi:hypothetical protein